MGRDLLTDLELMLLLAVLRVGENAYGVPIAREIEDTAGRTVALAVVYATLDRLEGRGLVASSFGDPTPERGGRAKRFFRVTPKGLRQVRNTQTALTALWKGVPALRGGEI
jgi:DNA-binding PadR family transcriptional regulator